MSKLSTSFIKSVLDMFAAGIIGGFVVLWVIDDRVVIEDRISGAEYEITHVDGKPVTRRDREWYFVGAPITLIDPGQRTFIISQLKLEDDELEPKAITLKAQILKGL